MRFLRIIRCSLLAMLVLVSLLVSHAVAEVGDWTITFADTSDGEELRMRKLLEGENALPDMVDLFESLYRMKKPVTLEVGAPEGPYYDAEIETITLPYTFALEIESRFEQFGDGERVDLSNMDDIVLDVVMHTLFHEMGHVLMAQYKLPLFFEEEDVVDSLANILLLEHTEYGAVVATSAAEMFRLEHEDMESFEASDFWGDHSLDVQRHYDIYCSIYASDPDEHADIIDTIFDGDEEQADLCIDTYERVRLSWDPLLKPILMP